MNEPGKAGAPTPLSVNVDIPGSPENGTPTLKATLKRVNVLLGTNGSGKSIGLRVLRGHAPKIWPGRMIVHTEAGRVIEYHGPKGRRSPRKGIYYELSTAQAVIAEYRSQRSAQTGNLPTFKERTARFFEAIGAMHALRDGPFVQKLKEWRKHPQEQPPDEPKEPLEELFEMFQNVFPQLRLGIEQDGEIKCRRGGSSYDVVELSDGEKQVLFLLGDLAILSEERSVVIIDEPEVNLNSVNACMLWDTIERARPNAIFIYGTHLLDFALRESVDQVLMLRGPGEEAIVLDDLTKIPVGDRRHFLGSVTSIAVARCALVTEGRSDESPFDLELYGWVLGDPAILVKPGGSCEDVVGMTKHIGAWQALGNGTRVVGVIDRDFRTNAELADLAGPGLKVLEYHEGESYLCDPTLLEAVAKSLKTSEVELTRAEIITLMQQWCRDRIVPVAKWRTERRSGIGLRVSIPKQLLQGSTDETTVIKHFETCALAEQKKAEELSPAKITKIFEQERDACRAAVDSANVDAMLRLFPGKEMVEYFAGVLRLATPRALLTKVSRDFKPDEFPAVKRLRDSLVAAFQN